MVGDRERCIEAGADEYIAKPVDVDRLMTMLKQYLK
jgi:CheY-like chemotaxis protein